MQPIISEPLLQRMKILIIDDERNNVVMLEHLLKKRGYSRVLGLTDSARASETCAAFEPDQRAPELCSSLGLSLRRSTKGLIKT